MRLPRVVFFLALLPVLALGAAEKKAPVFGELLQTGPVYRTGKKKSDPEKLRRALKYHLNDLNDLDSDVRQAAAEMLGYLGAPECIPDLIDLLRPERYERNVVQRTARAALSRLTGTNFGPLNYAGWMDWWRKNKDEMLKPKN